MIDATSPEGRTAVVSGEDVGSVTLINSVTVAPGRDGRQGRLCQLTPA